MSLIPNIIRSFRRLLGRITSEPPPADDADVATGARALLNPKNNEVAFYVDEDGNLSDVNGEPIVGPTVAASRDDLGLVPDSTRAIIYVSKDGTNTRTGLSAYDPAKPFLTIAAALAAKAAGDLILVGPGTYNEYDLVPTSGSVRYHFVNGAKVIYTGTPAASREFIFGTEAANTTTECHVTGEGHFEWAAGGTGYVSLFQNDSIVARISGAKAASDGSDVFGSTTATGMDVIYRFQDVVGAGDTFYAAHASGQVLVQADQITAGGTLLVAEPVSGARFVVQARRVSAAKLVTSADGDLWLESQALEFTGTLGIDHQGGNCYVSQARITTTNANGVIADVLATGLRLHTCVLVAGGSVTNGITASGGALAFRASASVINKAPHADASNLITNGLTTDADVA